LWEEEKYGII